MPQRLIPAGGRFGLLTPIAATEKKLPPTIRLKFLTWAWRILCRISALKRWNNIYAGAKKGAPGRCHNLKGETMKTRNISINSSLILHFLTSGVSMPQSIWAMLVGAFVYRCATIVVLGSTLALNAAAQSEVPTVKRKIKLAFQLADLWVPYGKTCIFYDMPNYNSTTGIWSVAMGNQGKASSPKCSLRIIEQRPEDIDSISGGGWKTYKKYLGIRSSAGSRRTNVRPSPSGQIYSR